MEALETRTIVSKLTGVRLTIAIDDEKGFELIQNLAEKCATFVDCTVEHTGGKIFSSKAVDFAKNYIIDCENIAEKMSEANLPDYAIIAIESDAQVASCVIGQTMRDTPSVADILANLLSR